MKKLIVVLFFLPFISSAQNGIDNLWMMGYDCCSLPLKVGGINIDFFSGSAVTTYVNRKTNFQDASASICNSKGEMLFYSNGVYIANSISDTMQNGSGLSPGQYMNMNGASGLFIPQAALILPYPDDSVKYYLIHGSIDDNKGYAYWIYNSEIDMTLDGGRGAVISKNNVILNDTLISGGITAVKHANGRDWWLIFHQALSNSYYIYFIDPYGIHFHSKQSIGVVRSLQNKGQLCFSPDGSKFAYYNGRQFQDLDIMDFDRCSGVFSNLVHVDINIGADSIRCGGVAFSPDSKVLYVSSGFAVYQFDLTSGNIASSKTTVALWDGYYSPSPPLASTFYLSQLAPDGKIYINSTNSVLSMHVINYPDNLGLACDVCQHCVSLPAYNAFTIPNHPNYHLGALNGSPCDTLGIGIEEITAKLTLSIYPNPVINNEITFSYSSTGEAKTICIYNIDGKEVVKYNLPQWSSVQHLKLLKLAEGVYLARLMSDKQSASVKFVVE